MKVKLFPFCMILSCLLGVSCQAAQQTRKPNVIIIMADDMGYGGPSCYGGKAYKTPGIDRLAAEGISFTDFHSSGNVCTPTRAGLLTGRYQQRAGIEAIIHPEPNHPEHCKGLQDDEITFADLFKKAGYATGMVGKWHLGYAAENEKYHPLNHGFDKFHGFLGGNIDYISHWGDDLDHDWYHDRKETVEKGYTTHLINKYSLEFIEENRDKPFLLYIAHEAPHAPVQGPGDKIVRGPDIGERNKEYPESKSINDAYQSMMNTMDEGVSQVYRKIKALGLAEDTIIVYLSDNGPSPKTRTDHPGLRGYKGSLYEGGHRVPAIFWQPGTISAGVRDTTLSISLDIFPTIISLAGLRPPADHHFDGVDLSKILKKKGMIEPRPLYWFSLSNGGMRNEAMRDGDWKLIVNHPKAPKGTFENEQALLFNLKNDLKESVNLAAKEPERVQAMLKKIKATYEDTQRSAPKQIGGWLENPNWNNKEFNRFRAVKAKEWEKMRAIRVIAKRRELER